MGIYQPDAGLVFMGAEYPFFVLEVAHSESEKHVLKKANEYVRDSGGGRIVFVMILWITKPNNAASEAPTTKILPESDPKNVALSTTSSLNGVPVLSNTPLYPERIDREYNVSHEDIADSKTAPIDSAMEGCGEECA